MSLLYFRLKFEADNLRIAKTFAENGA
jgi:hypothetical protein